MNSLNLKSDKSEFNSEPVFYCKKCLSLKVRYVPGMEQSEYCDECCSTDIGLTSIEEWEKMYLNKYGHKYIDNY